MPYPKLSLLNHWHFTMTEAWRSWSWSLTVSRHRRPTKHTQPKPSNPANRALMFMEGWQSSNNQTISQGERLAPSNLTILHVLHQSCPSQVTQLLKVRNLAKADAPPSLPLSTFWLLHGGLGLESIWTIDPMHLTVQMDRSELRQKREITSTTLPAPNLMPCLRRHS